MRSLFDRLTTAVKNVAEPVWIVLRAGGWPERAKRWLVRMARKVTG